MNSRSYNLTVARLPAVGFATALADAIRATRARHELRFVEVEVDTLDQLGVFGWVRCYQHDRYTWMFRAECAE